jgi:hypothetical protein
MKISVIAWDASFREKLHTIDSFCKQDYPTTDFEFIWVDFYDNNNPELLKKIDTYLNATLLNLKNSKDVTWHLGKCINAGVKAAKGDILVFPDGDIIVYKDHLKTIDKELTNQKDLVVYFRRWDELNDTHSIESYNETYLEQHTKLLNATNYAGCFALHRSAFQTINGYEESEVFAGPGANGKETYLRLRNAGFAIKWHDKKIYHPWHTSTGSSDKKTDELIKISNYHNWLNPYCGIKQSWVLKNRELDVTFKANQGIIENYMKHVPNIDRLRIKQSKDTSKIKSVIKKYFK